MMTTGVVMVSIGVVMAGAGMGVILTPTHCSGFLCGFGQGLAGATLMGVGGFGVFIGIPLAAVGGYRYNHSGPWSD